MKNFYRNIYFIVALALVSSLMLGACAGTNKKKEYTIGVVNLTPSLDPVLDAFKADMTERGYIEGENVTYLYDGPVGSADKLDAAAQKLVEAKVDLILAMTTPASQVAQQATAETNIPVVFLPVTDPVAAGIVQSLKQPGGNITGVTAGGSEAKRLQWQMELTPNIKKIYVPYNPDGSSKASLALTEATAAELNIELVTQVATTPDEVITAGETMPADVEAIFILADGFMESQIDKWIQVALKKQLPISATNLKLVESGVLFSYGWRSDSVGQQAARLADQILRGTKPAELPVERSEFYLEINLRTSEAIGLEIPDTILRQADKIIK
ncbi:MAG: ABC transporter substrate-binding protein [Chloroflexi bacterium]|nr:ABC transporter substrate-binding protein [Chloroflexota bacterium]